MKDNNKQSGFYLLSDNTDAFVARFALANNARKTLDIQYYIMHNDASGEYLAYAILAAADRGVHVRILVDDINLSGRDSSLKMLSQHDNIEIRIFNPLANRDWFRNIEIIINLDRAGRRMHNKVFIADDEVAIIGGRNIGDEYFDNRSSMNFVDLDLLTTGPVVIDVTRSFNDFWLSRWATAIEDLSKVRVMKNQLTAIRTRLKDRWHRARNTVYFHSLQRSELTKKIISKKIPYIWAEARLFYDSPEKLSINAREKIAHFGPQIMPYFEQAKETLLIATPYFVPGKEGLLWLKSKKQQGMKIQVLTNSLAATDVIAVHAGYKKYRRDLLKAGIDLYELKPTAQHLHSRAKKLIESSSTASLHAKYMVVDQRYVFIGSANIDPRSNTLNTEIGVMVDSRELAQQTTQLFDRTSSLRNSYLLSIQEPEKDNAISHSNKNKMIWLTEEQNKRVHYIKEPNASFMRKLVVNIMGLLPFESLL